MDRQRQKVAGRESVEREGMSEPTVEFMIAPLADVLKYYARGFSIPAGKQVLQHEAWVDVHKQQVVFRLILKDAERLRKA